MKWLYEIKESAYILLESVIIIAWLHWPTLWKCSEETSNYSVVYNWMFEGLEVHIKVLVDTWFYTIESSFIHLGWEKSHYFYRNPVRFDLWKIYVRLRINSWNTQSNMCFAKICTVSTGNRMDLCSIWKSR